MRSLLFMMAMAVHVSHNNLRLIHSSHALDRQVVLSPSLLDSISTNVSSPKMRIARSDLMKL